MILTVVLVEAARLGDRRCSRRKVWNLEHDSFNMFGLRASCASGMCDVCHCLLVSLVAARDLRPGAMPPKRNAQQDVRAQGNNVDLDEANFRVELI